MSFAEDWPEWRGPERDGISKETGWRTDWSKTAPKRAWTASVGTGFSSLAVRDGRVYTMGHRGGDEVVVALDAATGDTVWSEGYEAALVDNLHEGGPTATPTVTEDAVFTLGKEGRLSRFDARRGEKKWSVDLKKTLSLDLPAWGFSSSPLVASGLVIVDVGPLVAYDASTGKPRWKTRSYRAGYGSPIRLGDGNGAMVAALNNDGLLLTRLRSGEVVDLFEWKTRFETNSTTPLPVGSSRLFISTGYKRGCAMVELTTSGLVKKWETKTVRNHMNSSVLIGDHLYGFDGNSNEPRRLLQLVCIRADTGERVWGEAGLGCGSLIAADGKLIALGDRGTLVVVEASPEEYRELGRVEAIDGKCWTPPVLANGKVYCRNAAGKVVALDVSAAEASR